MHVVTTTIASLLVVTLVCTATAASAQGTSSTTCASTFHQTTLTGTVVNPPISAVDVGVIPETAQHYQIDCAIVTQKIPVTANRQCAEPPNQRLQLCHTPVSGAGSGTWTCTDVTQYFTTQFSTVVVGSRSGPELRMKFTWMSSLTSIECYPRTISISIVGLSVPQPGTELGASIAFIILVAVIAGGAVAYGAYAFWRVSKKFEHRDEATGGKTLGSPQGPQEAYKAALAALGAPPEVTSFYDEGDGMDNGGDDDMGGEDDEEMDYYDEENPEGEPLSAERRMPAHHQHHHHRDPMMGNNNNNNTGGGGGGPTHAVLDNNQVVQSTAAPTPWFAKYNNNNAGGGDGGGGAESIERSGRHRGGGGGGNQYQQQRGGGNGLVHSDDDDDYDEDYGRGPSRPSAQPQRQYSAKSRY